MPGEKTKYYKMNENKTVGKQAKIRKLDKLLFQKE